MGQESQNHFRARAEQEVPAVGDQSWHPRGGRVVCPKRGFVAMNGSPAQGIPSIASPILGAGASEVAEVIDSRQPEEERVVFIAVRGNDGGYADGYPHKPALLNEYMITARSYRYSGEATPLDASRGRCYFREP